MSNPENITLAIRHKVKPGQAARYEAWLKKIMPIAASYPGHQGAHVLRPSGGNLRYEIAIRFSSMANAKNWIDSVDRKNLLAEIQDAFVAGDETEIRAGIDFWFSPEEAARPKAWKQWLLTTSVIAPLTMIVPFALGPVFTFLPPLAIYGVRHLLSAAVIVAVVIFLVMPRLVHWLRPWLFR